MDWSKIFKKQEKRSPGSTSKHENPCPYTRSKSVWIAHNGGIIAANWHWQITAILCLLITLSAVGGLVYSMNQSKFIPYVVEVDKLGQTVAVFPAGKANKVDVRIVRATLADWVSSLRMVSPDIAVQRKAIFRVYANLSIGDPATQKSNEWLNGTPESTPFSRAETVTVHTSNYSVIAQSPDTWQVDWTETVRDRDGQLSKSPFRMRALINVYVVHPTSATSVEDMQKNPIGLFIKDYNWSEQTR